MGISIDTRLFGRRNVPFVSANDLNECGLACMAAIAEYFRGDYDLADIRRMARTSGRGETMLDLRDLAERMGLSARGVRVEMGAMRDIVTPAILHWEMNHFVVLESVGVTGIRIMDPAAGSMHVPWSQVDKSFTGIALEVKKTAEWRVRTDRRKKSSVLSFVGPLSDWRKEILAISILTLLVELLVLAVPMQIRLSVDVAVQGNDEALIWALGIGFLMVVLLQVSISVMRTWNITLFSTKVGFEIKDRFVRALHRKSAAFFLKHHSGDILSRGRSVEMIQNLVSAQLLQALLDAAMSVAIVIAMFLFVPLLAVVVVSFGVASVLVTSWMRHRAIEVSRRSLRVAAKADTLFLENARAGRAIKLFGKEQVRINVWRAKQIELTNLTIADGRLLMYSGQNAMLMSGLGNVALVTVGSYMVLNSAISLGTMMMFFVFRMFFIERLNFCVNYIMELRRIQTHAERIEEVMTDEPDWETGEKQEKPPYVPPDEPGLSIELRDIWFRYGDDSPWILQGVNMKIEAGENIAITGPSGCGKTTLTSIMLGLLTPSRGEVLIGGRNLASIESTDYAKAIGVVMQDDMMFQGTVAQNICFFEAPIDMVRVQEAAKMANIAGDIESMPMKYYSVLAEGAGDISGGQRQRIFIARALYHQPKLLFLDEATSHLDMASEKLVAQAVRDLNMTRVLIAHRAETIATVGRVYRVDPGCGNIVESTV